ncbi:TetR/AcrR family transcriptional regulator [Sphingobium sp. CR2-8]|uniref:TetR/AcrR family transcriptional regulator n=1 Tax=Sphingobium sp. CR2-8 TaxID=1306534 RepID=UPI002DBB5D7A|nr:TetR/AcrR family transcriptional regulator [Sphingobium sp. CR2-8]MEC3909501.1 TetR/AcrR family transcriptional regulator [Sphingobium sp. CR2-8]
MAVKPLKRRTQEERRQESQARILEAAKELLVERGYDRFSLQHVGQAAGCSYELINHYFGNKDGLLQALAKNILATFSGNMSDIQNIDNGFDDLSAKIRYIAQVPDRDYFSFSAFMRLAAEAPYHAKVKVLIVKRKKETLNILSNSIERGMQLGHIKDGVDVDKTARIIYEFLRGYVYVRLLEPGRGRKEKLPSTIDGFLDLLKLSIKC